MTEFVLTRVKGVAWFHGLRGYDATHLAAALFWQEMLGEPVTMATYDRQLWDAARSVGMYAFAELPLMCILHGKLLQQQGTGGRMSSFALLSAQKTEGARPLWTPTFSDPVVSGFSAQCQLGRQLPANRVLVTDEGNEPDTAGAAR